MVFLGNVVWLFLCGGIFVSLMWFLCGLVCLCTVVGIPWAYACFLMAWYCLMPFGHELINRKELTGRHDLGTMFSSLGNIVWFCLAGIWLAIGHLASALIALGWCIFIITIPICWYIILLNLKLAAASLAPCGKQVVTSRVANLARDRNAVDTFNRMKSK